MAVGRGAYAGVIAAHSRVLLLLGFDGLVVRARPTGTWINGQYRWAATSTWWPEGYGAREPQAAAAGLARRWLAAFGPGTRADLAWWAGWNLGVTKRADQASREGADIGTAVPTDLSLVAHAAQ